MKKAYLLLILIFLSVNQVFCSDKNLKAYFTFCTFLSTEDGPYIETYLTVVGNSVEYIINDNGLYQGKVLVTMLFKQGDKIVNFKKYNLLSPEYKDTLSGFGNFIDQQRIILPEGKYDFEIELKDNNSDNPEFVSARPINIYVNKDEVSLSDIELVESYKRSEQPSILTKSGIDLVPYVSNFFPASMKNLTYYVEIYNTDKMFGKGEKFLLNFYIQSFESASIINQFRGFERSDANPVNILLKTFNIESLPSGNYNLVIEVRDKTNTLIADKKLFFQRSNPNAALTPEELSTIQVEHSFVSKINNSDTLTNYIHSLRPICSESELRFIDNNLKEASLEMKQKFFLNFWKSRNMAEPENSWNKYKKKVSEVNRFYKTQINEGYETDRGRIYLRYGPPNTVATRENEPSSYPYEIWHYYNTDDGQSNVKFVFYNPDLVTNHYVLLHSTAIGEIKDYRWQLRLQMRNTPENNLDIGTGQEHWGSEAEDLFNHPK